MASQCINNNIPFIAVTGSTVNEINEFKSKYKIDFPIYFSDETPLKTAIRNNPGLILLKDGYVMDKWSFRDIPNFENLKVKIEAYNLKLKKYKSNHPPILPNGVNLDSMHLIHKNITNVANPNE
jgi:hypothetical protein